MKRDFTFIDDIVEGIIRVTKKPAQSEKLFNGLIPDPSKSSAPYKIFNIGSGYPIELMKFIKILEQSFGFTSEKQFFELQPGDISETYCDTKKLKEWVDYQPNTTLKEGLKSFANWYLEYCKPPSIF